MTQMQKIELYWNSRAKGFASSVKEELEEDPSYYTDLFRDELSPEALVLDCGAGTGFFTILLSKLGHRVTAIDYSPNMLDELKVKLEQVGVEASVHKMDAQRLDFPDACFDAVVSRNLTWNLENPTMAYREWRRVLKPGGKLLNFDGNYYLHLHDQGYAQKRVPDYHKQGCHARHNMDNVDFSAMEDIARLLPLSALRRPQWDTGVMLDIGFRDIRIRVLDEDFHAGELPMRFLIQSVK